MTFRKAFICLWLLTLPASGETLGLSAQDSKAPIEVSADNFLADLNAKSGTYSGNVIVKQGNMRVRANTVRIDVEGDKPRQIRGAGNIVFNAPSGNARGDALVYDVGPRLVTLTGNVVLTKDKNVMRGPKLTINLASGEAQLGGKGTTMTGGRVQGLFIPEGGNSGQSAP
jgi:lipopolysaccharide export system protein LptA